MTIVKSIKLQIDCRSEVPIEMVAPAGWGFVRFGSNESDAVLYLIRLPDPADDPLFWSAVKWRNIQTNED